MDDPATEFCILPTISWVRLEGTGLTGKKPCRYPVPSITASDLLFPPCTDKSLFCSYNPRAGPLGRLGRTEAEPLALTVLLSEPAEAALRVFQCPCRVQTWRSQSRRGRTGCVATLTAAGFKCGWHTLLTMHRNSERPLRSSEKTCRYFCNLDIKGKCNLLSYSLERLVRHAVSKL